MSALNYDTKMFLNAVTNPFGHTECAKVPDGYRGKTVSLTDYNYQVQLLTTFNDDYKTDAAGIFIMLSPWYNIMRFSGSNRATALYGVIYGSVGSDGILRISSGETDRVSFLFGTNYSTITGSATSYDRDNNLAEAIRIYASGLRVWPVLEYVTDSTASYMTGIYAGHCKPLDIFQAFDQANDIRPILRNSPDLQVYSNAEGATVRLDPFMHRLALEMRNMDDMQSGNTFDGSDVPVPFVYVTFSQLLANNIAVPFYLSVQYWMEGSLSQPTPIFADLSPVDPDYDRIVSIYSSAGYPTTSAGHSFGDFLANLSKFTKAATVALKFSGALMSGQYTVAARVLANAGREYAFSTNGNGKKKKKKPQGIGITKAFVEKNVVAPNTRGRASNRGRGRGRGGRTYRPKK